MKRAVFIDRDGVICYNRADHVKDWKEFVFLPGALRGLERLADSQMPVVVVTNQAIINRQMVTAGTVERINARMVEAIEASGGRIDRVMVCPHRPDEHCDCRKPQPGLLLKAARELNLDLARSYLIGDAQTDLQAAWAAGCKPYLVLTGRGRRQLLRCLGRRAGSFRLSRNLGAAIRSIQRDAGATIQGGSLLHLNRSSGQ